MTISRPGWPLDLVSAHDPEFPGQVTRWLLDRLPGEFRDSQSSKDPVALAWVLRERIQTDIDLMRRLYATARTASGAQRPEALLDSLSAVGAQLLRTAREVNCVASALADLDYSVVDTSALD
ncbi:MAG: hypothetical protein OSA11_01650 [Candidatus Nanopelagicales bacterium]|jgi:hypothetical protein|nr:hypothetical protein [Candidatus Nanopelagicales bacterium]MDE1047499.1 hypothetical protein [Candidatus Nanopelagicales bacterium]|tara:strand:- start:448 stop:813 length:366 start_codon:yes stop_codon:yes gene_type:complete